MEEWKIQYCFDINTYYLLGVSNLGFVVLNMIEILMYLMLKLFITHNRLIYNK